MATKTFIAESTIPAHRFVTFANAENRVKPTESSSDVVVGVSDDVDVNPENTADIHLSGCKRVQFGESVKQGDYITASADGKAVKAAENDTVVGVALENADTDEYANFVFRYGQVVKANEESQVVEANEESVGE